MKFVKNFQQSITIASRNYSTQSKYSNRWCIVCTRYTVRELCILGCAWPRRTRGAQWRDTRVFTRATPTGQPWRPGWKSRDVRRVRDCVHACIRPFVCTGFDRELPLRDGGETRANQSPSAFGFATPYVHHPPTSPEFRWSSPGNRFISPPFHPTVDFQFLPWIPWGRSTANILVALSLPLRLCVSISGRMFRPILFPTRLKDPCISGCTFGYRL